MGAYNVLFHFDKLYRRLGQPKSQAELGSEAVRITPMPLFLVSTLGLLWMGLILGYISLHEMIPGNRGNAQLNEFYMGHLIFGCGVPVFFALLVNVNLWWARWPQCLSVLVFFSFYSYRLSQLSWPTTVLWPVQLVLAMMGLILAGYIAFNSNVKAYYQYLKKLSKEK